MRKSRDLLSLSLLVVLLVACAPASTTASPAQPVTGVPSETLPPSEPALDTPVQATAVPTENIVSTPLPIATSRGPNLEATDPTTVSLASEGVQFVEFFRFTWTTCRAMAPMVHGLEAKYFGKIKFAYLDADDPLTADFQQTLGFVYQPEIYLLDASGNVLKKWVGNTTQEQFEEEFAKYVQ